jgi:hypothetical protein
MAANDYQIGRNHYQTPISTGTVVANGLDYFQAAITKYVVRWRHKGGVEDLKKAQHYLAKYMELIEAGARFTKLTPHGISEVESEERLVRRGRDASLVHWADRPDPDVALCGASYGMYVTDDRVVLPVPTVGLNGSER